MRQRIGQGGYKSRIERVRSRLEEQGADHLVLFSAKRIAWLTGYHLLPTERPAALLLDGHKITAFVPRLEVEAAEACPLIDEVQCYFEYPGEEPPLKLLINLLKGAEQIIADSDGYPGIWGYEGPRLSELLRAEVVLEPKLIDELWLVKSPAEIEHEPPLIDRNSPGEMHPGQVFSIEPGIYIPGHGGYRHSDTILITDGGVEVLTDYPRDLESLTIEV